MAAKLKKETPQQPLILRCHRLIEAFTAADDEIDFFIDRQEGFLIQVDLEKSDEELHSLSKEIQKDTNRYYPIPKLTFYETKKIMESFVNEKVYDIDTKEKLLEIIQSKEAMANFLDFISDHPIEFEKWQQFYQERTRIRIIEWLRLNHFHFVFEEDLEIPRAAVAKLKENLFESRVGKEIQEGRKALESKAKTYYSSEALNPRPKRGRPPKQVAKQEVEPQVTNDIFTKIPKAIRPFLFAPDFTLTPADAFRDRYQSDAFSLAGSEDINFELDLSGESLKKKLSMLKKLSSKWVEEEPPEELEDQDWEEKEEEEIIEAPKPKKKTSSPKKKTKATSKKAPPKKATTKKVPAKKAPPKKATTKKVPAKKAPPKKKGTKKAPAKKKK